KRVWKRPPCDDVETGEGRRTRIGGGLDMPPTLRPRVRRGIGRFPTFAAGARRRSLPCSKTKRSRSASARSQRRDAGAHAQFRPLLRRRCPGCGRPSSCAPDPHSARKRHDRPVTPEVAGSSAVAPLLSPHLEAGVFGPCLVRKQSELSLL